MMAIKSPIITVIQESIYRKQLSCWSQTETAVCNQCCSRTLQFVWQDVSVAGGVCVGMRIHLLLFFNKLVNQMGQNILHLAVMHRQRGVFRAVKNNNRLVTRMSSTIDHNGYTLLPQVAHMKHYHGGTKPGPALELQEEIKWFKVS